VKIKLPERLLSVASMILPGKAAADIGTDHGYLPVHLVVEGICPFVIATDRARSPLESARQLVELLSLTKTIDIRFGEGLEILEPGEVATICMAGVGGATIRSVLSDSPLVLDKTERLVLQPQRGAVGLRRWLADNGFTIVAEDLVMEDGFYYEIIGVEHGHMVLDESQTEFGPLLLANRHPLLKDYLELKKADLTRLIDGLSQNRTKECQERLAQLSYGVQRIERALKCL